MNARVFSWVRWLVLRIEREREREIVCVCAQAFFPNERARESEQKRQGGPLRCGEEEEKKEQKIAEPVISHQ